MIEGHEDITDKEYNEVLIPYHTNFDEFMERYIIPEVFAFELANSHYRNCLCDASFQIHYNSMCDVFNGYEDSFDIVKPITIELLKIKYNLIIKSADPLIFKNFY